MPNWCASNIAVTGSREELTRFAGIVNSLPSRPLASFSDFGSFWLGNLVDALGGDWNKIPCRGNLNADPDTPACFYAPSPDPRQTLTVPADEDVLRFNLTTAWDLDKGLLNFIRESFPSFDFNYKSTDEWGNFHHRHDSDGLIDDVVYEIADDDRLLYAASERAEFLARLAEMTGIEIPEDISDSDLTGGWFCDAFCRWRDGLDENDMHSWAEYIVWTNV